MRPPAWGPFRSGPGAKYPSCAPLPLWAALAAHTRMGIPYVYGTSDLPHMCMGCPICVWDAPYAYGAKYTYSSKQRVMFRE